MLLQNKYLKYGLTIFATVASILLFYDTLFGSHAVIYFVKELVHAAQPVLYGAMMAYLLAPLVNFFEFRPFAAISRKILTQTPEQQKMSKGIRACSILLTWAVIGVLLYLLASVLIPEVYKSFLQLLGNMENYYDTISGWIEQLLEINPMLESWVTAQMDVYFENAKVWVQTELLPQVTTLMGIVSGSVMGIVGFLGDLLVGVIVSIYFLATKETCAAQAKRVLCSLFPRDKVYWILRGSQRADRIFSGFVRGKLLDSLIIGVLCFIGCSVLNFPYTPLVSLVVGITNIIPFFGPFLGAIPSTILILLVSPKQALYFIFFVLALQQLDGNVIGPKILGDSTGLSSLWVIVAILVGGSFFGVVGMFFGVPVCACLYALVNFLVDARLKKKALPLDIGAYAAESAAEMMEKEGANRVKK